MIKKIAFVRISPNFYVKNPHPQNIIIPFDIAQIISLLPKNKFKPMIIDTWVDNLTVEEIIKKLKEKKIDILAITAETPVVKVALKIFEKIKSAKKNIFNIAFGTHVTFAPNTFLYQNSPVDVCVLGEPEITIVNLINNLHKLSKVPGVAFFDKKIKKTKARQLIENLDNLPFLAHEYFLKDNKYKALFPTNNLFGNIKWGFLLSSRGCPYNCTFCSPSIRNSYGKQFRSRLPKSVVDEIKYLIKNFGVNALVFEDDVFSLDMERAGKICKEIIKRKINISFAIQTRANKLNWHLLKKLKKAGCSSITLGVESGNEKILRSARKGISKNQIRKTVEQIKKLGISMKLNFIIGWPGETIKQAQKTLKFSQELNSLYTHFHYLTPYPGTEIYQKIATSNIPFRNFSHCNSGKINLSKIPQGKYEKLLKSFYRSYYFRLEYLTTHLPSLIRRFVLNPKEQLNLIKKALKFLF